MARVRTTYDATTARLALAEFGPVVGDHRCTPPVIWRTALDALGREEFDLDPATNGFATVPAIVRCTGDPLNGLRVPWAGDVWCNPPFSHLEPWVLRFAAVDARSISFLAPADLSTRWARATMRASDAWAAWPKREHFPIPGHPRGSPLGGVCLWYRGPDPDAWVEFMRHRSCIAYRGHP